MVFTKKVRKTFLLVLWNKDRISELYFVLKGDSDNLFKLVLKF